MNTMENLWKTVENYGQPWKNMNNMENLWKNYGTHLDEHESYEWPLAEYGKTWFGQPWFPNWKTPRFFILENRAKQIWKTVEELWEVSGKPMTYMWKRWNTIENNAHIRLYHNKFMYLYMYCTDEKETSNRIYDHLCTYVASACISPWCSVYAILLYICRVSVCAWRVVNVCGASSICG